MKFDSDNKFWKHKNCTDVFFKVKSVTFDDDGKHAVLWGFWMIQGLESFWCATEFERLPIKPEQYDNWEPYTPKHNERFS